MTIHILLLAATFFVAVVMAQALAHALEMPGKMRLGREQYYTVQTIYYPGFTWGGAAEPLAIIATAAILLVEPEQVDRFWLAAGALVALVITHALFWVVVQPVNRQWLASTKLSGTADRFFHAGPGVAASDDWTRLRDRWEQGHLARAVTATAAFVMLLVATSFGP